VTPEKQQPTPAPISPVWYIFGSYIMFVAIYTPLIAIAWNVGLKGAEIVDNGIGWGTALGLAILVMILRSIAAGARPTIGLMR